VWIRTTDLPDLRHHAISGLGALYRMSSGKQLVNLPMDFAINALSKTSSHTLPESADSVTGYLAMPFSFS
jgi:hypothetical protein